MSATDLPSNNGLPDWAQDRIHVDVRVQLGWRDALRVLLYRRFDMRIEVTTQGLPGQCETTSLFRAPFLLWRPWRKQQGYGMVETAPVQVETAREIDAEVHNLLVNKGRRNLRG